MSWQVDAHRRIARAQEASTAFLCRGAQCLSAGRDGQGFGSPDLQAFVHLLRDSKSLWKTKATWLCPTGHCRLLRGGLEMEAVAFSNDLCE